MSRGTTVLLGLALAGQAGAAGPVSHGPRELGEVVLSELLLKDGKIVVGVPSGGCTGVGSIRPQVEKAAGRERIPHHVVTFVRVKVDECKAIVDDDPLLEYDLVRDLGIQGLDTVSVANAVLPRSQAAITEEFVLRRALKESTLRAAELELDGYLRREKVARESGKAESAEQFHRRVEELTARTAALRAAHLNDYPSPVAAAQPPGPFEEGEGWGPVLPAQKVTLVVTPSGTYRPGSQLEVEGASRSGPFYHLAGGALELLEPGRKLQVTAYLVFRREYFGLMSDHYVHVAEVK